MIACPHCGSTDVSPTETRFVSRLPDGTAIELLDVQGWGCSCGKGFLTDDQAADLLDRAAEAFSEASSVVR